MTESGRHKACKACRERKIKCDGYQPQCRRCAQQGKECFYTTTSERYSKADLTRIIEAMNQRLFQAEAAAVSVQDINNVTPAFPVAFTPTASSVWPPFDSQVQSSGLPFTDPEYTLPTGQGQAQFTTRDEMGIAKPSQRTALGDVGMLSNPISTTLELPFNLNFSSDLPGSESILITAEPDADHNDGAACQVICHPPSNDVGNIGAYGGTRPLSLYSHCNSLWSGNDNITKTNDNNNKQHLQANSDRSAAPATSPARNGQSPDEISTTMGMGFDSRRVSIDVQSDNVPLCQSSSVSVDDTTARANADFPCLSSSTRKRRRLEHGATDVRHSNDESFEPDMHSAFPDQDLSRESSRSSRQLPPLYQSYSPATSQRSDAYTMSPCNSPMRRTIGNGTSFQGIPKLCGPENYDEWVRAIRAAARKEGVWDMMNGLCRKPITPKSGAPLAALQQFNDDLTYWSNKRELALGGIEGSLSESVQASVDNIECPRSMWLKLEEKYKLSDQQVLYNTMQKLNNLSLTGEESVERLAGELRQFREELGSLVKFQKLPDWYFGIRFLLSLRSDYNDLVSSIMTLGAGFVDFEDDKCFERIVALVISEEKRLFLKH